MRDPATSTNPAPGFSAHPERRITLAPFKGTVSVEVDGVAIARSNRATVLSEGKYPPVYYLPLSDVDAGHLRRSSHTTHCPYKGEASYWNVTAGNREIDNAVWGYETPYDEMLELAGLVAFYPSKVTINAEPA